MDKLLVVMTFLFKSPHNIIISVCVLKMYSTFGYTTRSIFLSISKNCKRFVSEKKWTNDNLEADPQPAYFDQNKRAASGEIQVFARADHEQVRETTN